MAATAAQDVTALIPLDRLAALGGSALAHCLALYRQRLEAGGVPVGAFNSGI